MLLHRAFFFFGYTFPAKAAMSSLATFHPETVHFAVALVPAAVLMRCVSLAWGRAWLSPAALALTGLGTLASVLAVWSGDGARDGVAQVPGLRSAVADHESWGEWARNGAVVLLVVETAAVTLAARQIVAARAAQVAAAVVGVVVVGVVARAADLGGRLVYGFGGGVGVQSGDPADVNRLLIAASHQQAALDRQQGRPLDAAALVDLVVGRFPAHLELQLAQVESFIIDRNDPASALARLDAIRLPTEDPGMRVRAGILRSKALVARGEPGAARQVLETLRSEFPANAELQRAYDELTAAF